VLPTTALNSRYDHPDLTSGGSQLWRDSLIAYVFWHHPQPSVATAEYESALRSFHEVLSVSKAAGLLRTTVHRMDRVPWLDGPAPVFEDWHYLDGSAALDVLNDAAVSGDRTAPHNRVAAMAGAGTAGLYSLRLGQLAAAPPRSMTWLSKPAGMTYQAFFDSLRPICVDGVTLWGRQMTLGPALEFCIQSAHNPSLPYPVRSFALQNLFDRTT
jgi:hypothetical protein